jgi:thiol-disulfide isomerase/thioredoxin
VSDPAPDDRPGLIRSVVHRLAGDESSLAVEGRLASFDGATAWLNSDPLTPERLRGRVVVVDFWTYTCVNWLRTLPYLRAWAAKYQDDGLTVVGVHTPEFDFEGNIENVVEQARNLGVKYPIAVDSDYAIWEAFANSFWPALYVADHEGRLRFHHFGEGEYPMTEMVIQQLLLAAGTDNVDQSLVAVQPRRLELAADWQTLESPETYVGYRQSRGFAQQAVATFDEPIVYTLPGQLRRNEWGLSGTWTVAGHAATLNEPRGRIAFAFHARDLNLVMRPSTPRDSVPFQVYLDGQLATDAHGNDVELLGSGIVRDPRTYQLIRQSGPIVDRLFEIEFLSAGVETYCFTFG